MTLAQIDPALLRPGRLDKCVHCALPDADERLEILHALAKNVSLDATVDFAALASAAVHCSGADLKALLTNAELRAINETRTHVPPDCIVTARSGGRWGG